MTRGCDGELANYEVSRNIVLITMTFEQNQKLIMTFWMTITFASISILALKLNW
jgi:hypothetical protein